MVSSRGTERDFPADPPTRYTVPSSALARKGEAELLLDSLGSLGNAALTFANRPWLMRGFRGPICAGERLSTTTCFKAAGNRRRVFLVDVRFFVGKRTPWRECFEAQSCQSMLGILQLKNVSLRV